MKSRKPNKQELAHIMFIKSLPCLMCLAPAPSEYHHLVECGRRLGHLYGLPLCPECHRGKKGFSGTDRQITTFRQQWDLMVELYNKHRIEIPERVSKIVPRKTWAATE